MNQKERSSYDTILQILKSDATLLADSVVDNIMATQREKVKKYIPMQLLLRPLNMVAGRHFIRMLVVYERISRHPAKKLYWINLFLSTSQRRTLTT